MTRTNVSADSVPIIISLVILWQVRDYRRVCRRGRRRLSLRVSAFIAKCACSFSEVMTRRLFFPWSLASCEGVHINTLGRYSVAILQVMQSIKALAVSPLVQVCSCQ